MTRRGCDGNPIKGFEAGLQRPKSNGLILGLRDGFERRTNLLFALGRFPREWQHVWGAKHS